ncbi:MAG: CDP-2,3-bis-(O-geranylgeranyl)-sn-glycerol synthase [Candidatus Micrarchaeia archaeon]
MDYLYNILIYPIIYILPAYVANGAPVIFHGWGPLDRGKSLRGKRIFGDHKTIRGTLSAFIAGILMGLIESAFFGYMLLIAFMLTLGAIFGDLLGSFIKRRLGIKSGNSVPFLDQYGFFVFALAFAFWLGHIPSLYGLIFLFVLTGFMHLFTNKGAFLLGLKSVPW